MDFEPATPSTVIMLLSRLLIRSTSALGLLIAAACGKETSASRHHDSAAVAASAARGTTAPNALATSACDSLRTVCFLDTAYARAEPGDPGPTPSADWIWFGAAGDSLEIAASSRSYVTTSLGQEHDRNSNTAPYFRRRLSHSGVVTVWITLDEVLGDTVPYTLSFNRRPLGASSSPRATGLRANLAISSKRDTDRFSFIPLSLARSVHDADWQVMPRAYKVALVADSLYRLCRIPCSSPDTVKLIAGSSVTRRY